MQARYPYRTRAVALGCVAWLVFATSVALGLTWTAAGQLFLLAAAVHQFWQVENPNAMRLGPLQILAIVVLFIVALALGLDELMNSLEPLVIPSGVAALAAVIVFSVIPQIRRERQMRSG